MLRLFCAALLLASPVHAQVRTAGTAVLAGSRLDPAPGGAALTEIKLEQPVLMLMVPALGGRFLARATANFEGLSMPDGVLTPGGFGEGFVDRRHPHTYLHELVGSVVIGARSGSSSHGTHDEWNGAEGIVASLTAGKGFVAFGSDDPMNRPVLRFPINHHYAQILERVVAILGVRAGPVAAEATLFNGDEPTAPWDVPRVDRFGDSWAGRVMVQPLADSELSASYARVASPEHREGGGPPQTKWHAGVRIARGDWYGLAEWARTTEADGLFTFHSLLAEVEWNAGPHRPYYRFERTTRPEEERLLDPFRTPRPHVDDHILGTTRFTTHTAGYGHAIALPPAGLRLEPVAEITLARVTSVLRGLFDPETFYGGRTLWTVTLGARMHYGAMMRMGRYGVAR